MRTPAPAANQDTAVGALPTVDRAGLVYLPALLETFVKGGGSQTGLADLIAVAGSTPDYDLQIVPVSIFWGRDPGQETEPPHLPRDRRVQRRNLGYGLARLGDDHLLAGLCPLDELGEGGLGGVDVDLHATPL